MTTFSKYRQLTVRGVVAALLAVFMAACSTTRRIPDGEMLYTGLKGIEVKTPDGSKAPEAVTSELSGAVNVAPNNAIFGSPSLRWPFPVGLWVWNNWDDPGKGIKHWLYDMLVTEPVLVSDVRPEARVRMLDEILENNGYFRGGSSYSLVQGKNPKKARIQYNVETGPAYTLSSIEMLPDTCVLNHLIDSIAARDPYLRVGSRYCVDSLALSRTRIANAMRNKGYYYFRGDFVEYLADSVQDPMKIALRLMLASNIPSGMIKRYKTGDVTMYVFRNQGGGEPDTIETSRGTLIQMKPSRFRTALMPECVTMRKGRYFTVRQMNSTQTRLSRLGIFNAINIDVRPDTTATEPTLNVEIGCTFDTPLEFSAEINASSKSNSYLGPGISLGITNRNLFGGGEQLNVTLTGNYEWQTGKGASSLFNSYEFGVNASLAVPRMLAPGFIKRRNRNLNWTRFSLNADVLNRPHYFKMAQFNAGFSYEWQSSRYSSHSLTPFKLTYTKLMKTTEEFDSIIAQNPAIALSFMSQYIPQLSYTYTFDRNYGPDNNLNWTFTVQEAGNLFWSIYELCGRHGEKKLFGTPFSQFIKGTTQLVYGRRLWGDNWLVSRAAIGAAHAYGNSSQVPYAEQFYVGGANSIRAWTVRELGPGSYRAPEDQRNGYFDQTGTFKLELNTEYRFPIIGPLHGAVFLDAGNVWLLKKDPLRPGGEIKASTFLKEIALGTGVGLRFDISMLILRADLGIGIHAPYDTGKKGYYNMTSFKNSLAFHLAIGYPF
ncbi:MAG: BamA/TamA family outer membrane protein [Muribaculaceae bacterium]|nr:BamA/TamA family outer membrane protein [Muribaculaceae bacterium]